MTSTICLIGAQGGQGTTTIAAALAVFSAAYRPTTLVPADLACTAALLGVPPASTANRSRPCASIPPGPTHSLTANPPGIRSAP